MSHRTYLQYTATPQAPLLINIIDFLSPNFAEVLTPGDDYTGGREFFIERPELVVTIPQGDVSTNQNPLVEPPQSLLCAMRIFFIGVAAGSILDGEKGNRAMMIHPSHRTASHNLYKQWMDAVKDQWEQILSLDDGDPDKDELLEELGTLTTTGKDSRYTPV
jgi:hypothetical protein